ncbi:unnamed protein product [Gongylonema pulchrum]|uniref:Secreted protein n=1 Tax=Gongylonema pulchrum TaxID=637853 RepID=A0A183D7F9_9BILA|nr:unnamed protein product [Gongylonema pulchrum]
MQLRLVLLAVLSCRRRKKRLRSGRFRRLFFEKVIAKKKTLLDALMDLNLCLYRLLANIGPEVNIHTATSERKLLL